MFSWAFVLKGGVIMCIVGHEKKSEFSLDLLLSQLTNMTLW